MFLLLCDPSLIWHKLLMRSISNICRPSFKRSLSDGNILYRTNSPMAASNVGHLKPLSENLGATRGLSDSTSEKPTSEISYSRCVHTFFYFSKLTILRSKARKLL